MFDPWTATENEAKKEDAKRKKIRSFFDKCIEKNKDLESTSDGENQFAELKLDSIRVSAQTQRRIAQEMLEEQDKIKESICVDNSGNVGGLGSIGFMERINQILDHALPAPKWLAKMFYDKFISVYQKNGKSWDDADSFGRPHKKGAQKSMFEIINERERKVFLEVCKRRIKFETRKKVDTDDFEIHLGLRKMRIDTLEDQIQQNNKQGKEMLKKGNEVLKEGIALCDSANKMIGEANELLLTAKSIEITVKTLLESDNGFDYISDKLPPLDAKMFEEIGETLGISSSTATKAYYSYLDKLNFDIPKISRK